MELETILLADAASTAEGKLYVHGGGLTRLTPPMLPWLHPQITVVLIFRTDEADLGQTRRLQLTLTAPDESLAMPAFEQPIGPIQPRAEPLPGEASRLQAVLNFSPVQFIRPGLYRFNVQVDDEPAGSMNLPVAPQPPTSGSTVA
jgi:hypothetical protein